MSERKQPEYEAIIVGTGFGGMGAAIQLGQLGVTNIRMFDRADDLGGTWQINHYPGLAVDIASVSYSYSFEPNPYWSRMYAPGQEIKAYANHIADKYDLRRFMQFDTSVDKAEYDEDSSTWTVYPQGEAPVTCRLLILATGFLSQPKNPDIPGVDDFAGKVMHTAAWDHDYNMTGKRAAMIGTGASGVQVFPIIAEQLEHLDVYQRTPIWVLPKTDPKISQGVQKLFARIPFAQRILRLISDIVLETIMVAGVLHNRQMPFLTRMVEKMATRFLKHQIKDPELREKLLPSYSFGCKRPTFSNHYFRSFNRDNVDLVTDSIERIESDAIVTADGQRREIDTLVLATGFNLWEKGNFPAFDVVGTEGRELGSWWNENHYQSYEGITVPGFPNLFNLHGPFAYSGFNYFDTVEVQMAHMKRAITRMQKTGVARIEVKPEAMDRYMTKMKSRDKDTVFTFGNCSGSNSYYFNQHGEMTLLRLSSGWRARRSARTFPLTDYQYG